MIQAQPFGKYQLLSKIAAGGMAEVYRAKLVGVAGFEKVLAVKRILPHFAADDGFVDMFVREANVAVRLAHSNVVQVFELGRVEDSYYIALEFVDGKDLKSLIRAANEKGRQLPADVCAWVVKEMCAGLHHAHTAQDDAGRALGIVHRDISPHNVLVSWGGEVKVADFGIAKLQSAQKSTRTGMLKGKLAYMSPEQSMGDPDLDARSDVFATGIVLYECLTGRRPFESDSDRGFIRAIQSEEPAPPSSLVKGLPAELDLLFAKATAKKREDRFPDAAQMGRALGNFLQRQAGVSRTIEADDLAALMKELLGGKKTVSTPPEPKSGTPILDAEEIAATRQKAIEVFAESTSTVGRMETVAPPSQGTITRPPSVTVRAKRSPPALAIGIGALALVGIAGAFVVPKMLPPAATPAPTPTAEIAVTPTVIAAITSGTLLVEGSPAGATVTVGELRGKLGEPLSIPLDAKEAVISAEHHRSQKIAITLVDGKATAKATLVRGKGSLRIGVPKQNYSVRIAGVADPFTRIHPSISAGRHTAEISDGTKTVKATVLIRDGLETKMVIKEPLRAGVAYAP